MSRTHQLCLLLVFLAKSATLFGYLTSCRDVEELAGFGTNGEKRIIVGPVKCDLYMGTTSQYMGTTPVKQHKAQAQSDRKNIKQGEIKFSSSVFRVTISSLFAPPLVGGPVAFPRFQSQMTTPVSATISTEH